MLFLLPGWAFHLDPSTMPPTIAGLTPLEPAGVAWMLLLQSGELLLLYAAIAILQ